MSQPCFDAWRFHADSNFLPNYSSLHLLCLESYVFMSPFYYCDYQSILFCAEFIEYKIPMSSVPSSDSVHSD
jgi:hypothetical protein